MAAPLEATENRLLDALVIQLRKIGIDGGRARWHTLPEVHGQGWDPAATVLPKPALYLDLDEWEEVAAAASQQHLERARGTVWLVVSDPEQAPRVLWNLKRDVLKALRQGEGALIAIAQAGVWALGFTYRRDLSRAGLAVGQLSFKAEYQSSHTDP